MSSGNWTQYGPGTFSISTAQAHSATHSIMGVSGVSKFLYNGVTYTNSRLYAWCYQGTAGYSYQFETYFMSSWGAGPNFNQQEGYKIMFYAYTTDVWYASGIVRYNAGVATTLQSYWGHTIASALNTWHRFRLTCRVETVLGYTILTCEWYNPSTSLWEFVAESMDDSASKITAAGYTGFGFNVGNSCTWIDDIQVLPMGA